MVTNKQIKLIPHALTLLSLTLYALPGSLPFLHAPLLHRLRSPSPLSPSPSPLIGI